MNDYPCRARFGRGGGGDGGYDFDNRSVTQTQGFFTCDPVIIGCIHSKNEGMKHIPTQYDSHTFSFHTALNNSMTITPKPH